MASPTPADFLPILSTECILSNPGDLEFYGHDSSKEFASAAALILLPREVSEVQEIVRLCEEKGFKIVPSGGRTGYSGGATAQNGEVVLSLERMNKILAVDPIYRTITCEGGVSTEAVQREAEKVGLFYGVDFPSKGTSQIAGNVATNAGGVRVIRHGNTRDWILGLKVVTGGGKLLDLSAPLIKNQTGYDLKHLFIGSEGTLGIVVEVTLKLELKPESGVFLLCALSSIEGIATFIQRANQDQVQFSLFEYIDRSSGDLVVNSGSVTQPFANRYDHYLLLNIVGRDEEAVSQLFMGYMEEEILIDVVVAQNETQRRSLMDFRERISETIAKNFLPHKNDISVPRASLVAFLQELPRCIASFRSQMEPFVFGHIGDGNLHINFGVSKEFSPSSLHQLFEDSDRKLFELVASFKGSVSAEHGVGLLKKPYIGYSRTAEELSLMKGIKAVFDPRGVFNPGKIFDIN